jgi:hypothetical protein
MRLTRSSFPRNGETFEALCQYAAIDRLSYLLSLTEHSLSIGTLLDYHHQTVLRLSAPEDFESQQEFVDRYANSVEERIRIWRNTVGHLKQYLDSFHRPDAWQRYNADGELLADEFCSAVECLQISCNWFRHRKEFAYFPSFTSKETIYGEEIHFQYSRAACVDAMNYYSLSSPLGVICFQDHSIGLLSLCQLTYAKGCTVPGSNFVGLQANILRECAIAGQDRNIWKMLECTMSVFRGHEWGHSFDSEESKPIRDILRKYGWDYKGRQTLGFPTAHDYGAWDRIGSGKFTIDDIIFLLGDTLANINYLYTKPPKEAECILRTFNWHYLKLPSPRRRVRGLSCFLLHAIDPDPDSAVADLDRLFSRMFGNVDDARYIFSEWERRNFDMLSARVN